MNVFPNVKCYLNWYMKEILQENIHKMYKLQNSVLKRVRVLPLLQVVHLSGLLEGMQCVRLMTLIIRLI